MARPDREGTPVDAADQLWPMGAVTARAVRAAAVGLSVSTLSANPATTAMVAELRRGLSE